jgi:ABC-type tungstate transport system permease subunit
MLCKLPARFNIWKRERIKERRYSGYAVAGVGMSEKSQLASILAKE